MSIFLLIFIDIFTLANIWYSRNFHAYISISLYCEFNNLHGLKNNIIDSMKVLDCIIPISTIIFVIVVIVLVVKNVIERRNAVKRGVK